MNENAAYIFDVESPDRWVFDGDPVWIRGWFLSKVDAVFTDIRAVIEGVPYPGILGLPRPEIEARHRGRAGLPHAGFLLRVQPPRGARELRLELLDAGHNWVEIWRTGIKVRHGQNTIGRYHLPLLPAHLRRLLQARQAEPAGDLAPLAGRLAQEASAVPLELAPEAPFHGGLSEPGLMPATQFGKLRVEGWLVHETRRIVRVVAGTDPRHGNELDFGDRPNPAAAARFPQQPQAGMSQFFGLVDFDETRPGPVLLTVEAELDDGTHHLVLARRFHPQSWRERERPLPACSAGVFLACAHALHRAARDRRLRLGRLPARWQALRAAWNGFRSEAPERLPPGPQTEEAYAAWLTANRLTPRLRHLLAQAAAQLAPHGPRITILADLRGADAREVHAFAASLREQHYPHWELRAVGLDDPGLADPRCRFERAETGGDGFIAALNRAIADAPDGLVTLLPARGRLHPAALLEFAERFASAPELQLAYMDEDRLAPDGRHHSPVFKPDWSPTLLLAGGFPGHPAVVRTAALAAAGGFREGTDRVAWHDVLLRLADRWPETAVTHLPVVGYHAPEDADRPVSLEDTRYEQARASLTAAARRRGWEAEAFLPELAHHRRTPAHQLRWSPGVLARMPVTIVIPTRDKLHLLQECVERLEETVDWRHARLVIVDDHSRDADAVRYLARIVRRTDLRCSVVRLPDPHAPFNYSRLVNAALPHVDTPLVLHLNNDVNALEPGWLEEMAGWFTQPDVGVVGAKLVFPDRTLNHTGIVIGPHGGLADTPWARRTEADVPVPWHGVAREVSAVTGACLLTRTDLYRELGGFDETAFGVAYNDVDYCLRVRARGSRVLYTPQARLMHWGSATRGVTFDEAEHMAWLDRHAGQRDPYFSPHWRLDGADVVCRGAVPARTARVPRLHLLLLTHNLNLEGAPLFLLEYASALARDAGFTFHVLAALDGPLRDAFAGIGAGVTVADTGQLYAAPDEETFHARLLDLAHQVDWDGVDLVVCNTLVSFWGVPLARRAGKPSLLYIHESASVSRFFGTKLARPLHALVHEALRTATRTLFLCEASRAYHADDNVNGSHRIVPSWIDFARIESHRAARPRAAVRAQLGYAEDETVIANIGTVCERKGQHDFIRAAVRLRSRQPAEARLRFVLVGARPGIYLDLLRRDAARLGLDDLVLVPETTEVLDHFVAADLFVCTSHEESFPRVVMEAMACGTPIVSTDVHGIAELIGQRQDGYLVKPGDVEGLARMMQTCLAKERSGKSLAGAARSKVRRFHDARLVLPWHAEVAREAYLDSE